MDITLEAYVEYSRQGVGSGITFGCKIGCASRFESAFDNGPAPLARAMRWFRPDPLSGNVAPTAVTIILTMARQDKVTNVRSVRLRLNDTPEGFESQLKFAYAQLDEALKRDMTADKAH